MIITLVKADFSSKNIGILESFAVLTNLGNGLTYVGPSSVKKNTALDATIVANDNIALTDITITMGGVALIAGTDYTISGNNVVITIAAVTGVIVIDASSKIDTSIKENVWYVSDVAFEVGTTSDDSAGTMGNLSTNNNRLRTAEAIKGDQIRITAPVGMYVWYNIFDDDGKLVGTSGNSLGFTNSEGTGLAVRTIDVESVGGTQIWPIFKTDSAGSSPVTDEQKSQIVIEYLFKTDSLTIDWEVGTFSDSTGEKIDNAARLRTPSKIEVPVNATGIAFIPTGTFDLWIKTYDTVDQLKPTMNGIKGSQYWKTNYAAEPSLTWAQICSNNQRPNYIDFVLKTSATNLIPSDAANVIINFVY